MDESEETRKGNVGSFLGKLCNTHRNKRKLETNENNEIQKYAVGEMIISSPAEFLNLLSYTEMNFSNFYGSFILTEREREREGIPTRKKIYKKHTLHKMYKLIFMLLSEISI